MESRVKVFGGRFAALPKYAAVEYPAGQTLVKGENGYVLGEAPLEYDLDAASVEISLGNGRIYTVKQTSADTKNTVCVTVPSGVEATLVLDGIKNTGAAIVLNVAEGATLWVELDGENVVGSTSCSSTAPFRKIGAGLLVIQDENGEPGSLTATVGQNAAAIGGSYKESVSNIEIKSGTITATSGQNGAAIGAGGSSYDSSTHGYVGGEASNITVSGGTLKLTSGLNGAVIGAGSNGSAENITVSGGTLTLTGGKSPLGAPSTSKNTNVTVTGGTFATANVTAVKPFLAEGVTIDETTGKVVQLCNDEKSLRKAFYEAPTDGTAVTVKLGADITLETLYAAENFGTEKLDDNAEGDTFNRYKVGVHPTAEDPNHWNSLVTGQTQEQCLVYGAYYHMSATDERIARLVVKAGQKIVLDLNGHTIQKNARATHGDWSEVCTDIIGNYGTLEIMDSSTGAKGTIKGIGYISCQGAVLHNYKDATMTVTGVNVDGNAAGMAKGTGQYAIANDGGTLTLDGVNVHDTATSASLIMSNGGTVTIKNATLSHPATKVINAKGGVINIESASVTSEEYAVFVTGDARVNVNGSLTIEGTGTLCVEGDAAALTKKAGVELSAPAGFTWVENDGVQVLKSFVAKVGKTAYVTIAEALAALSAANHTLTLLKDAAWDAVTPVYWAAGTQSGYAATLTAALTAAYKADAGAITIVCRPGADVGTMTHGHVADDLTIYGNDAFISGGECDLEVDQYKYSRATGAQAADGAYLEKDITITAYELDNLGVWGDRHTAHMVTVNLTDCDGKAPEGNVQRVYISGTTGVNNITLTGCDFLTKATAVYSNADGAIKAVNCSFTDGQVPFNINHKANGKQTVAVENCTFTNCGDAAGDWKQFAAPLRLVNSGTGTQSAEVTGCAFAGTVGANGDILLGDGRTGQASNDVELKVVNTAASIQAQKPGYYGGETVDETKKATAESPAEGTLETSVAKLLPVNDGSEAHPYSREQFAAMTRADYITAQERLGGTLYVNVGDYAYGTDGVLGNGVRNDTPGQVPDHSMLNAYGENGYLGEGNDDANGHAVVFVGGTITSGVTGYTSIDNIGTSLLLAVPAYTKVTFKETTFKNVLSFDYQLYTSPWSQLGGLTFKDCTFDGIIVGAIASQELAFNGCTFKNYVNTTDANSSNPTWIRPAYGNWTKGDNEGQGTGFRSLTKITFENNTVTSTRPVKFERIAQWEMATTVTATGNTFAITPQEGDKVEKKTKNVGLYFGANAKFDLVIDENKKSNETAALYTAVYSVPNGGTYAGLPAGSTVKNAAGEEVSTEDALAWKTTDKITLKTTTEVASVTNAKGVANFATLAEAIAAAKDGETVKLLADVNGDGIAIAPNTFKTGLTVDFGGHTYTVGGLLVGSSGTVSNGFQLNAGNKITFKNGVIVGATATAGAGTDWKGAPAILIQNYCDLTLEQMTVKGGDETCYTLSNNNGEIVIDGSTIVAGKGTKYGPFAFDVCRYASYPSVHVTVKGASVIEGDVEISGTIGDNQSRQLDIEEGMFKGAFKVVNQPANIAISGGTFATAIDEAYCAAGFIPTKNADGTYGVKKGAYVAQVGTTKYDTVDAAMEAAAANETATTVKLLAESVDETVVPTWYIKGDVTVDADSAVKATFAPIENAADAPDTDGMAYIASDDAEKARTITVGEKVTLSFPNTAKETGAFYIGYGKDGNWAPTHLVLNGRIEAYEPYIGVGSSLMVSKTGSLKSLSECLLMRRGSTVTVTGTDGAWSAEKPQVALGYGSQQGGEVTFKDTFVTGGAFWTMWNRNGNADVATKLTLDNTAFTAGAFKGTASSGETSAYQVELKNGAKMTIAGDFAVIAEGAVTIESGSLLTAKSISNAGTLTVRADALTDAVRVVDYTGTGAMTLADYGTVKAEGGELYVEDNDLWIRRPAVAEIGTVKYATLAAAIAAAQAGETVTLLADITLTSKQSISKELTLDLNGKTLTGTALRTLFLGSGANVTIQDSSAEKTGKVANGYKGRADPYTICLDGYSAAALTLVSGTVEANPHKTDLQSVAINTNHEKDGPYAINIKGGKVFVPESSTNGRAIVAGKNVTLTVEGGEIVGGLHGVDVYGGSTTAITGGSISARVVDPGKAAYGLRATGTAIVTIGAADGTADGVSVAGIMMNDNGYKLDVPAVTVNSGTIAGPVYSITPGTIVFNVQATSEDVLRFADDTAAKFLPSNLELRAKDIDGKTMYYVAAKPVAAIGAIDYATLADAIAAAKDGETVKLLADVNGDGIAIAPNTFKTGLTVDFGGHTYTVGGLLVGSSGTVSNGFQLNAGNKITFKNGVIVGATATAGAGTDWKGAPAILIQNYCDLTLEQMTVKGGDETCYTLSNNNGEIVIDGSTIVAGKGTKYGPFAFDVCRYASYPSVHVTVKGASVIEGDVEISGTIGDNQSRQLDIEGGTFKGAFKVVNQPANIAISGGTFSDAVLPEYCAAGFIPTANDDGTYGVKAGAYVAVTLGGEKKEMPFPDAWLADNIGADASSWTTAALEGKAKNGLAKWQCYLFGLDPNKKEAKVVATAGQGTDEKIPLAVANADASASPLVKDGYVTVAYVLMGSNDRTAWTQVATSNKRDGLAIPLTGTTYKFYRVDVTVTSAEGN